MDALMAESSVARWDDLSVASMDKKKVVWWDAHWVDRKAVLKDTMWVVGKDRSTAAHSAARSAEYSVASMVVMWVASMALYWAAYSAAC
jgi:hypothetical protein